MEKIDQSKKKLAAVYLTSIATSRASPTGFEKHFLACQKGPKSCDCIKDQMETYKKNVLSLNKACVVLKPQDTVNDELNVSHFWHSTTGENI